MAKRLNINVSNIMKTLDIDHNVVDNISHDQAVALIRELSKLQQNMNDIPSDLLGYQPTWKQKE
jgi:hypothetical protein